MPMKFSKGVYTMRKILVSDLSLKAAAKAEQTLSFREKLEIAKQLDRAHAAVIETPPVQNDQADALLIKSIAAAAQYSTVCVPVALSENGVTEAWEALKAAARPRLQVCVPMSVVQMEYLCHKKPPMVLSMISILVRACRALCADVEFCADDATRAAPDFLQQAVSAAMEAGASTVTVCDDAGTMLPDEFSAFITGLYDAVPALRSVTLGVRCSNELGMAVACAGAAMLAGADEIKVSAISDEYPAMDAAAQLIRLRGDSLGLRSDLNVTELQRCIKQARWIAHSRRSKTSPFDAGVQDGEHAASLYLNSFDDIAAVSKAVKKLGYDLSEEDLSRVFEEFVRIARQKNVGARELDAIVASAALQVPATYRLVSYVINCGNVISASAHLQLEKDGKPLADICIGDGPVDAAFLAIEQIIGHHYELDDFQIQTVTEGREAMGSALVKLRSNGRLYSGKGISTDIIGAAIRAYLNALNKIVYEEA